MMIFLLIILIAIDIICGFLFSRLIGGSFITIIMIIIFGRLIRLGRLLFGLGGPVVLHLLEQVLDGTVVHRLEARERERRRVAHREEDHRIVLGLLELVVEQALVEDADVLAGEVREVNRGRHPGAGATLADLHLGAGDELKDAMHVAVGHELAVTPARLEERKCTGEALGALGITGREERAAVGGHGQCWVRRALVDEAEERQHARPSGVAAREAAARPVRVL